MAALDSWTPFPPTLALEKSTLDLGFPLTEPGEPEAKAKTLSPVEREAEESHGRPVSYLPGYPGVGLEWRKCTT